MNTKNFASDPFEEMMRRLQEVVNATSVSESNPVLSVGATSVVDGVTATSEQDIWRAPERLTEAKAEDTMRLGASQTQIDQILAGLNAQQRQAVTHSGGHLLVIAGAGSGKTRVLTTRISYLIATNTLTPGEILAITFTNKAAKEMRERLETMLGSVVKHMWISTFHSACVRILRAEHEAIGYRSSFTIYDAADAQRLIKMICAEESIDPKQYSPKYFAHKISDLKNELITPAAYTQLAGKPEEQLLAKVYAIYQERLRAASAMDFDDLIMKTVLLLKQNPAITQKYRRRFRHILVDEYQDTNPAQYELVRILVGAETGELAGELTVVGDADQSIYAFRGATIRNIESFETDFPNATAVLLEQNYRSTQNILSAANALISHNVGRRAKNLWTDAGQGDQLIGYVADNEREEAQFIAEEISELQKVGYKYGDIAVFYRANAQSRALEETLMRSGIPYRVVGGTKFYDRMEIKDALAYLQAIANPDDTVALRRIFNVPKRGLGDKAEASVANYAARRNISFGQAIAEITVSNENDETGTVPEQSIDLTARAKNSLTAFWQLLETARQQLQDGIEPAEILDFVLDESGYVASLQASHDPQDEVRIENLAELHSVAADFIVLNPEGNLAEFLEQVSLVSDSDQLPEAEKAGGEVVLMTVHTAKGLEFPVVFATGFEDGTFPHARSLNSEFELAEERRLAYVALTRARKRLYVTRAACRSQWGAPQALPPSRFLSEIPAEVIDWRKEESWAQSITGGYGYSDYDEEYSSSGYSSGYTGYSRKTRNGYSSYSDYENYQDTDDYGAGADSFAPAYGAGSGTYQPYRRSTGKFQPEKLGKAKSTKSALEVGVERTDISSVKPKDDSAIPTFQVGQRVRHKSFGAGVVRNIEGSGRSAVAKVKFDNGVEKRLMLRFAPLEKI